VKTGIFVPLELYLLVSYGNFMSVAEIIQALPNLSPEELQAIQSQIDQLQYDQGIEASPEMLAAIDEGRRSLREEGKIPIAEIQKLVASWNTKSL
jgi:hypothetical protein